MDTKPEVKEPNQNALIKNLQERFDALATATRRILAEPFGCPACHSGKIITERKEHWTDCGYRMAEETLKEK